MNDLSQTLKAGTLLIIETGEYSDRGWGGPVKLLRNFTKQELADDYRKEWRKEDFSENGYSWNDEANPNDFLPWLIKTKRAEHVDDVHSWHIGSYSSFEP